MNALINTAVNPLVGALRRSGLLADDLDYHIVRASMVIMFLFFGYQKWWAYEAERLVPFIKQWSADLVALSCVRPSGRELVLRGR